MLILRAVFLIVFSFVYLHVCLCSVTLTGFQRLLQPRTIMSRHCKSSCISSSWSLCPSNMLLPSSHRDRLFLLQPRCLQNTASSFRYLIHATETGDQNCGLTKRRAQGAGYNIRLPDIPFHTDRKRIIAQYAQLNDLQTF